MATLTQKFLSMADVYKRTDGFGNVATIMEMMNGTAQDIFTDFTMMECNDGTKHIYTTRTGLSAPGWGALYEGIVQGKTTTQQVTETTGFVEKLISVDKRVLELAGANAAARPSEGAPVARISTPTSAVSLLVVAADEERAIAEEVEGCLSGRSVDESAS